jgi:hypothetical protein
MIGIGCGPCRFSLPVNRQEFLQILYGLIFRNSSLYFSLLDPKQLMKFSTLQETNNEFFLSSFQALKYERE